MKLSVRSSGLKLSVRSAALKLIFRNKLHRASCPHGRESVRNPWEGI